MQKAKERKIIHIDMDAFYASVEQRDHPELRGIPVGVGRDVCRGVLTTASYEARRFGVHSAMPVVKAKKLCPELVLVSPDFDKYKAVSQQVHAIFHDYTDVVEPLSLDEAFLDVTENKPGIALAVDIAREIRQRIHDELHLTASAGVSYNKFLAKVASDFRKPNGLTVIHPDRAFDFISNLPITDFWGVGHKTAYTMHHMGIFIGQDLRRYSLLRLTQVFGKMGAVYHQFARGIDLRPVVATNIRKSVGCERTFMEDTNRAGKLLDELRLLVLELSGRLARKDFKGRTLTLKVKFHNFIQITRSITKAYDLCTEAELLPLAERLLEEVDYAEHPVRLLGLTVSNRHEEEENPTRRWVELELPFKEEEVMEERKDGPSAP